MPPLVAGAKLGVQISVRNVTAHFGSNIEGAHCQYVDTVPGDGAQGGGDALHHACMNVRALGGGDMDAHTGAAEDQGALKLVLGDHGADAQTETVEHQVGVVRVAVCFDADIGDFPTLLCQMLHDRFLQRKSGKIGGNKQFFVRNSFHGICLLYTHTQICFWAESPPDNCIVPYFLCNVNSQIGKIKRKLRRHRNQSRARTDRARRGIRVWSD